MGRVRGVQGVRCKVMEGQELPFGLCLRWRYHIRMHLLLFKVGPH